MQVLLIVDMVNDLEFEEGHRLVEPATRAADNIRRLRDQLVERGSPVVYINDNSCDWRERPSQMIQRCSDPSVRGHEMVARIKPRAEDYFVLKSRHSGFLGTNLDFLLQHLGARQLILTGITTDICVLFTANDAYMRQYELRVPGDCCASTEEKHHRAALEYMERVCSADIRNSTQWDL